MNTREVFFQDNCWNYIAKEVDLSTYHITYNKKTGFLSNDAAQEAKDADQSAFLDAMDKIRITTGMKYTFAGYLEYWFKDILQPYAYGSYQSVCAWIIFDLIIPAIEEDLFLSHVTPAFINKLLDKVSPACKSAAEETRKLLHVVMKSAVEEGYITENPVEKAKKVRRNVPDVVVCSKGELKKLLAMAKNSSNYFEILSALFIGLRSGEIRGLKYTDFDPENRTVTIRRQITSDYKVALNSDGTYMMKRVSASEKPPKSYSSYRCLRVPEFILDEAERRHREILEAAATKKKYSKQWLDYLCLSPRGTIKSPDTCTAALKAICRRAGIRALTMHQLRHIFASIMIEQGVSLQVLSRMMGHKSVGTTLDIYCGIIQANEDIQNFVEANLDPYTAAFQDGKEVM